MGAPARIPDTGQREVSADVTDVEDVDGGANREGLDAAPHAEESLATTEALQQWLKVKVILPKRGLKKQMVSMAMENARVALDEKFKLVERSEERTQRAAQRLGTRSGSVRCAGLKPSTTPISRGRPGLRDGRLHRWQAG